MIPYEIRQAIVALKTQARLVRVSRNTVRRALRQPHARVRRDSPQHEALVELLPDLYRRCRGNAVRIRELFKAEQGIEIPYYLRARSRDAARYLAPSRQRG